MIELSERRMIAHRVGAGAERLGEALFGHLQCFLRLAPFFHGRGEKQQGTHATITKS